MINNPRVKLQILERKHRGSWGRSIGAIQVTNPWGNLESINVWKAPS